MTRFRLGRPRFFSRLAVLAISCVLASGVAVTVSPASASAAVSCPSGASWVFISYNHLMQRWTYDSYTFTPVSSTPVFNVSDSRIAINDLDDAITVTFTSSQARTFTISVSASMQAKLLNWLTATISSQITRSRTTQVGVSVTATVPAHSRIQGDYGVEAFLVTYQVRTIRKYVWLNTFPTYCTDLGTDTQTVNAPTIVEGWRVWQV